MDTVNESSERPAVSLPEWLAMLPQVVMQLEPAQHENFVAQVLTAMDQAGIELARCVADEFVVAKNWM